MLGGSRVQSWKGPVVEGGRTGLLMGYVANLQPGEKKPINPFPLSFANEFILLGGGGWGTISSRSATGFPEMEHFTLHCWYHFFIVRGLLFQCQMAQSQEEGGYILTPLSHWIRITQGKTEG